MGKRNIKTMMMKHPKKGNSKRKLDGKRKTKIRIPIAKRLPQNKKKRRKCQENYETRLKIMKIKIRNQSKMGK